MDTPQLAAVICTFCSLLISLAGIIIYFYQKNKQKKMTARTTGHVVRYSYRGEGNLAPVIAYSVNGRNYEVRRKFRGYIIKTLHMPVPVVIDSEAYVSKKDYLVVMMGNITDITKIAESLWPMNTETEVFYNPSEPKKAYATKLPKLPSPETVILFWTGLVFCLIFVLLAFLL